MKKGKKETISESIETPEPPQVKDPSRYPDQHKNQAEKKKKKSAAIK